jgi:hypothetical protein
MAAAFLLKKNEPTAEKICRASNSSRVISTQKRERKKNWCRFVNRNRRHVKKQTTEVITFPSHFFLICLFFCNDKNDVGLFYCLYASPLFLQSLHSVKAIFCYRRNTTLFF